MQNDKPTTKASCDEDNMEEHFGIDTGAGVPSGCSSTEGKKRLAEVSERSDDLLDYYNSHETTMTQPGQHMTLEQRRTEAKRTYNRMNAARARLRTKQQIEDLTNEVDQYAERNIQLQRLNAELVRQVETLSNENGILRQRLSLSQGGGVYSGHSTFPSIWSGLDPSFLSTGTANSYELQHQALLQSLSLARPGQLSSLGATTNLLDSRSLFPSAPPQEPSALSPSLASLIAQRDSLEQQRLLMALGSNQPSSALESSRLLADQLSPAQLALLNEQQQTCGAIGSSHHFGELSEAPSGGVSSGMQTRLLRALLAQQQQQQNNDQQEEQQHQQRSRDGESSSGS